MNSVLALVGRVKLIQVSGRGGAVRGLLDARAGSLGVDAPPVLRVHPTSASPGPSGGGGWGRRDAFQLGGLDLCGLDVQFWLQLPTPKTAKMRQVLATRSCGLPVFGWLRSMAQEYTPPELLTVLILGFPLLAGPVTLRKSLPGKKVQDSGCKWRGTKGTGIVYSN